MAAGGDRHFFSLVPRVVLPSNPPGAPTISTNTLLPFYNAAAAASTLLPPPSAQPAGAAARRRSGFDDADEPPLLDELGIDVDRIRRKALSVLLHPLRAADPSVHADPDLTGPMLILLAFALLQFVITGRFLLGVGLWWMAAASVFLYGTAVRSTTIGGGQMDLYRCVSVVGYSTLPLMVVFPVVSVVLPRGGVAALGVGMGFVAWSSSVCVRLLMWPAAAGLVGEEQRHLARYPCWLVCMLLALLVFF